MTTPQPKICNCRGNINANKPELPCSNCGGENPMKKPSPQPQQKLYKVRAEIKINPSSIEQVGKLMSEMDLGICGVEQPIVQILSWTTSTKPTKKYKKDLEKTLQYDLAKDGDRLISIKWLSVGKDS